ncbi:MAG: hypothetical protein JOZ31_02315 [Verrucomicrobia bacterium]|nr:hypothetical protein [Verrucomicrobiota bacterium]MBV8482559.1 hypothetical protein [Verrucomicrobiota bacterium]
MENPFLLAVALWESRKITTRLLGGAKKNEPDFRLEREKPIDWLLLVDDTVQTGATEGNTSNPAARSSDQEQDSSTPSLQDSVRQNPRTSTRTKCRGHLTRGSCA